MFGLGREKINHGSAALIFFLKMRCYYFDAVHLESYMAAFKSDLDHVFLEECNNLNPITDEDVYNELFSALLVIGLLPLKIKATQKNFNLFLEVLVDLISLCHEQVIQDTLREYDPYVNFEYLCDQECNEDFSRYLLFKCENYPFEKTSAYEWAKNIITQAYWDINMGDNFYLSPSVAKKYIDISYKFWDGFNKTYRFF